MLESIYAIINNFLASMGGHFGKILPKIPKVLFILVIVGFLLGNLSHATFPIFKDEAEIFFGKAVADNLEQEWLTESEQEIACQAVIEMSNYGDFPCYSIGELRRDFKRNESEAVRKYAGGHILAPGDEVEIGNVYIVGKSRNEADYVVNAPCSGSIKCLRKRLNLGGNGKVKDNLVNESFDVIGEFAIELPDDDFHIAQAHLLGPHQSAFMAFIGSLRFEDHVPTRKGVDTHAFVLRLQGSRLISPL